MQDYDDAVRSGFTSLFAWHFRHGTRPSGSSRKGQPWTPKEFAHACGAVGLDLDPLARNVGNWLGGIIPVLLEPIESAFFGRVLPGEDHYVEWRMQFRRAYAEVTRPSPLEQTIEYYSCFISYSHKDEDFAQRIHADLQANGIHCWYAPHDIKIGDKLADAIDAAISGKEKLLLILSENSIRSDWVEDEVTRAFEEERQRGQTVLFPVRLDDAVIETNEAWAVKLRARLIGDFRHWKDHDRYKKSFERVLRDLTVPAFPGSRSSRAKLATVAMSKQAHAVDALKWYRERRHSLAKIARKYYDEIALPEFRVVTTSYWLPERPIPLHVIDRDLEWRPNEPDANPPIFDSLGAESYSEFLARVAPTVKQENNFCYRLLGVSRKEENFEFAFGPSYYANFVSSCDALGYELAEWNLRNSKGDLSATPRQEGHNLVTRGRAEQIFNLRNRSACPGTSAVLILLNTRMGDYFYIHERTSPALLDSPGGWHVVPSGQFQPDSAEDVHHARDFTLTRTVMRELAEELLGEKEVEEAIRTYDDFYEYPKVAPFIAGLENGTVRPYFMGLGFDALPTKPGFYLALVIDAKSIPEPSLKFFNNWEGRFLAVPLSLSNLEKWSQESKMIPDGATCLKLAARHLEFLVPKK